MALITLKQYRENKADILIWRFASYFNTIARGKINLIDSSVKTAGIQTPDPNRNMFTNCYTRVNGRRTVLQLM
jgi:hypothetical protein